MLCADLSCFLDISPLVSKDSITVTELGLWITWIKEARNAYFSKVIASHSHKARILFQTIGSMVIPSPLQPPVASAEICEDILIHFIGKIEEIRHQISLTLSSSAPVNLNILSEPPSSLSQFKQISLFSWEKIIAQTKSSTRSTDILPSWFLKTVFHIIGPYGLSIVKQLLVLWLSTVTSQICWFLMSHSAPWGL